MKYVVLLRGINVSGKNKISMIELNSKLKENNYRNVTTYLNSGNIILESDNEKNDIAVNINIIIKENFDLDIPVYVITYDSLKDIYNNIPDFNLLKDIELYNNIIFIFEPLSTTDIMKSVGELSKDIDFMKEYKNVIYWSYDLKKYQKSNWWKKTASVEIKDKITMRTTNTIKKLIALGKK